MSDAILPAFSDRGSLVRHAIAALVVIAGGAGGLVYWAASTEIAGAVVANGTLVVESHPKLVQHQDGGR
jgi:HlyD family secretion protein